MATLQVQGSVLSMPDGDVFRPFDERMPLALPAEVRTIVLTVDSPVTISLAEIAPVHMMQVDADFPVVVQLTSAAGTSQGVPIEFMLLKTRSVPITGISLIRVAGQTTTVRLTLGQGA